MSEEPDEIWQISSSGKKKTKINCIYVFFLTPNFCSTIPCSLPQLYHRHTCVLSAHLSLTSVLFLEELSIRPPTPEAIGSSTTTCGLSRKHQPLCTPTWSLLSWMTTALSVPSAPASFWERILIKCYNTKSWSTSHKVYLQ